jgi:hypothetical protein
MSRYNHRDTAIGDPFTLETRPRSFPGHFFPFDMRGNFGGAQ